MLGLKVEFIDGGYEIVDNVERHEISEGVLTVEGTHSTVIFNFDCVRSIRYVSVEEETADDEEDEEEYPEPDIENILKRLFSDGII